MAGTSTSTARDAGPPARRPYRRHSRDASSSDAAHDMDAVAAFLQNSLGMTGEEVDALDSRGATTANSSPLQLANCQGWTTFLASLCSTGDIAPVRAIITKFPQLLRKAFDEQRLQDLAAIRSVLSGRFSITNADLVRMAKRNAMFLAVHSKTVLSAVAHLEAACGDPSAARRALLVSPVMLASSRSALGERLQWLTEKVGLPADVASIVATRVLGNSVQTTLEPHRQWLESQGFAPDQIARIVRLSPNVLCVSMDALRRRMDAFRDIWASGDKQGVVDMVSGQPTLLCHDLDGQLMQLKMRYGRDELGFSDSDMLQHVPHILMYGMSTIGGRHSLLRDVLGVTPTPDQFKTMLIQGSADERYHFGPRVFATYVRQGTMTSSSSSDSDDSSSDGSVQGLLLPLADKLRVPGQRDMWVSALTSAPSLTSHGTSTSAHCTLYARLWDIHAEDWQQSDAGVKWLAAEAAAKQADMASRAAARESVAVGSLAAKTDRIARQSLARQANLEQRRAAAEQKAAKQEARLIAKALRRAAAEERAVKQEAKRTARAMERAVVAAKAAAKAAKGTAH